MDQIHHWEGLVQSSPRYACTCRREKLSAALPRFGTWPEGSRLYREEATPGGMDIRPVSREEMGEEALGLLTAQGSQERAEGKLMIDENC